MALTQQKKFWPWAIGCASLVIIFACILAVVFGAGKTLLKSQNILGSQAQNTLRPTESTAVLREIEGWVEVQNADGEWSQAAGDKPITAGQSVRTGKLSSARLVFNDGSEALLKSDSQISVDELKVKAKGQPRTIVMTQVSGESSHQVVPNKDKQSAYDVRTPSGTGTAKGTEFQVVVTAQQTAYFYVVEGVVAVSAVETTVLVDPGFMTILYINQPPIEPVQSIAVEGLVSQAGDTWTVAGTTFTASDETVVIGTPQPGDWVAARGHLDGSGQVIADMIVLLHSTLANKFEITGVVGAIEAGQWEINGQAVEITETTTLDDDIQVGDTVYVKGLVDTGGLLKASSIERVDEDEAQPFAFTGVVQQTNGVLYEISGVSVTTNASTVIGDGAKDSIIKVGDLVRAKGSITPEGTWLASEITLVTENDNEFSFTGKLESKDPWKAAGISFETRTYTVMPADLKTGELVRVEGEIDASGIWIATKIERIDLEAATKMVIIGTVISIDPWVVSGTSLTLAPGAVIGDGITVGMLVRVELVLQDGAWLVVRIDPVNRQVWFPGCTDVIATVISVDGNQLQLKDWPRVTIEDGVLTEGDLTPNTIIRMRVCFDETMIIKITYIIIIQPGEVELPPADEGGKVAVCHKPDKKKGGHTLSISRSALPAHLGHGDYAGACR